MPQIPIENIEGQIVSQVRIFAMSYWEEALGQTRDMPEKWYVLAGSVEVPKKN